MSDYNTFANSLKRSVLLFADSLSKTLSIPVRKFLRDMIFGILSSQSVQLASISRALHEPIDLKKTQERLSRNLQSFSNADYTDVMINHAVSFRSKVGPFTPVIIDHTDISKSYARKMEDLSYVWDGSRKTAYDLGYCICEAAVFDADASLAVPVYTDLYSYIGKKFKSANNHLFLSIDFLHACYGSMGIYTMDRGMDDRKVFSYLSSRHLSFAIRLIGNRLVTGPGADTLLAASLAARYKGKFSASFISKNGNHRQICFSAIPVQIPSIPEQTYVMLVVKGYSFKPLLLLCNPSSLHKDVLLHFIQAYIARWNIEEIFRYRKVSSALESIQVRSLRSIFAMNLLAMLAAAFATTLCISKACRQLYWFLFDQAQRERRRTFPFPVYAIADGIRAVLSRFRCGIRHLAQLSRRPPTLQQLMFPQITQLCAFQVS